MTTSIWASVEFFCIAADLGHDQYLQIVKEKYKHQGLCKEAYDLVKQAFNTQMMQDKSFMPKPVDNLPDDYEVN